MLPEPFANTPGLSRRELSRYDDRGPAWAWDTLEIGEHVGTHFDAPIHWITGRDGEDVASVPPARLVGPAVVIDKSAEAAEDPDYLLRVDDIRAFEAEHGAIPEGAWLLLRTGWDARADDQEAFLNGAHTPGPDAECARFLAEEAPIAGFGVETVGTDAGAAHSFDPPFPVHHFLLGAGQLRDHPARQPRRAAAHRRGDRGRAAEARERHRQPVARARAGLNARRAGASARSPAAPGAHGRERDRARARRCSPRNGAGRHRGRGRAMGGLEGFGGPRDGGLGGVDGRHLHGAVVGIRLRPDRVAALVRTVRADAAGIGTRVLRARELRQPHELCSTRRTSFRPACRPHPARTCSICRWSSTPGTSRTSCRSSMCPGNLDWAKPFEFTDRLGGLLVIAFTGFVIFPLIQAARLILAGSQVPYDVTVTRALGEGRRRAAHPHRPRPLGLRARARGRSRDRRRDHAALEPRSGAPPPRTDLCPARRDPAGGVPARRRCDRRPSPRSARAGAEGRRRSRLAWPCGAAISPSAT